MEKKPKAAGFACFPAMEPTAHFSPDKKSIEVAVRPRKGSASVCSRCHLPVPDQLAERRFEFIPPWGFLVFILYTTRRVDCRRRGVWLLKKFAGTTPNAH